MTTLRRGQAGFAVVGFAALMLSAADEDEGLPVQVHSAMR
jgi:hypothetical protein